MQHYQYANNNESSPGDDIPERDVTCHLMWLLDKLWQHQDIIWFQSRNSWNRKSKLVLV